MVSLTPPPHIDCQCTICKIKPPFCYLLELGDQQQYVNKLPMFAKDRYPLPLALILQTILLVIPRYIT